MREIGDAALRDDAAVRVVDLDDLVELAQAYDDGVLGGDRAARERRSGAARHDLHAFAVRELQNRGDFRRRLRQHDCERPTPIRRQCVGLVRGEPHIVLDDVACSDEAAQLAHDAAAPLDDAHIGIGQANHRRILYTNNVL